MNKLISERWLIVISITSTALILSPVLFADWLDWDDPTYVLNNIIIQDISFSGIANMFSTLEVAGTYSPILLLSYALDYALVGNNPSYYHLINLLLHLTNVFLVFIFTKSVSKDLTLAFFSALIFGIHPFHVESVAWISSRKDLLMGFFGLISLIAYARYLLVETTGDKRKWYLIGLFSFIFGVLSKGVLVGLPLVLISMNYLFDGRICPRRWMDKVPYLILSLPIVYFGWLAQLHGGAVSLNSEICVEGPIIGLRNLWMYAVNAIFPFKLSAFHPYQNYLSGVIPARYYVEGGLAIIGIVLSIWKLRGNRLFIFGISIFLIFLLPVLQFAPIGQAIIAERYSYLPFVGFWIAIMSLVPNSYLGERFQINVITIILLVVVGAYGFLSHQYTRTWNNSISLWSNVIEKYPENYFAYGTLANYYQKTGDLDLAIGYYTLSLERNGNFIEAYNNRGLIFWENGDLELALKDYSEVLRIDPTYENVHINIGLVYLNLDRKKDALESFNKALKLNSKNPITYFNRALLFKRSGLYDKALEDLDLAIGLDTSETEFYLEKIRILMTSGDSLRAKKTFTSIHSRIEENTEKRDLEKILERVPDSN